MTSHKRKATKQKSKKNDILLLNNSLSQRLAGTHTDQIFLPGLSCPDVADNSVCLGTALFLGFFIVSETAHFGRKLPINCQCINLETNNWRYERYIEKFDSSALRLFVLKFQPF